MQIAFKDIRLMLQRFPCALTQGYVLDCGRDNTGGSKEFYIGEHSAFAFTVAAGVVTAITKDSGKQFFKYEQVKQVSETQEELTASEENGTVFSKQTIKLVINKRQVDIRNEIMLLAQSPLAIIEVDQNGDAWLYGADRGVNLAPSIAKSGRLMGDRNGYELNFEGFEPELAYKVDSALIATLTTPGA